MIKRGFLVALALLAIWATARFCHHQTKGFCLSKLQGNTTCLSEQLSEPMSDPTRALLCQKFTYLGRGLQSFSFVSEDRSTVLKLFNNRYQRRLFWYQLPLINRLCEEKIAYNKNKWAQTFQSYQLAYDLLKEEAALLYFHPAKSHDCPKITLVDALGIAHEIDLNKVGFVMQKKATMVYPFLEKLAAEENETALKEVFFSLFALNKRKMDKGIADNDPLIRTNFGFAEGKAVQIDIGPFTLDPSLKDPIKQKEKITKMSVSLQHWLEWHHPRLLPYFYEALETF